jgi:hypothetical protein
MTEQVFGYTVNEVMAGAAILNVVLVAVLVAITAYYARHAKRQADASKDQVAASNRQADAAQKTLDLLLKQTEQQKRIDVSTVRFQLDAAIHMIDDWLERIVSETYNELPDVIEIRPTNFSSSIANADRVDGIVAGYMGASLLYIAAAETDIRIMCDKTLDRCDLTSPLAISTTQQGYKKWQGKAAKNLNIARLKLDEARTRLVAITEGEQYISVAKGEKKTA